MLAGMPVSPADRRAMERQAAALSSTELDASEEGDDGWRAGLAVWVDEQRERIGVAPIKTEIEFYRRARALGLRRRGA